MTRDEFITFASEYVSDIKAGTNKQFAEIIVPAAQINMLAHRLKREPATRLDYLFCLTAADRKDGFNVVYHLASTSLKHELMLKVILADKANAVIPSVSATWTAAEFYEREVFDLFGITFTNHPDLRRLFLDENWE